MVELLHTNNSLLTLSKKACCKVYTKEQIATAFKRFMDTRLGGASSLDSKLFWRYLEEAVLAEVPRISIRGTLDDEHPYPPYAQTQRAIYVSNQIHNNKTKKVI